MKTKILVLLAVFAVTVASVAHAKGGGNCGGGGCGDKSCSNKYKEPKTSEEGQAGCGGNPMFYFPSKGQCWTETVAGGECTCKCSNPHPVPMTVHTGGHGNPNNNGYISCCFAREGGPGGGHPGGPGTGSAGVTGGAAAAPNKFFRVKRN